MERPGPNLGTTAIDTATLTLTDADTEPLAQDAPTGPPDAEPPRVKARLRFAKTGDLRMVSHHDLLRCLERLIRRAGLPVARSQGFNPRPRIVFAMALALGVEGRREVVEIELTEPVDPKEVRARLAAASPPGLDWLEAEAIPKGKAARAVAASYRIGLPPDRLGAARTAVADFLGRDHWPYTRRRPDKGREIDLDLRPFVIEAAVEDDGTLSFRLRINPDGSARPEEVVEALGLRDLLGQGAVLARTDLELAP